ncbi:MAG: META domain-containing protein [Burkholderiaceae bacterium]
MTSIHAAVLATALALLAVAPAASAVQPERLTLSALKNTSYSGITDLTGSVRLQAGAWQGKPPDPSSASVPRVVFLGNLVARGDLNGDGTDDAVVMLASNYGGTGVFHHLAVVTQVAGGLRNIDTRPVGDRIQVRDLRVESGHVVLDMVRAGRNDGACCPTEVVSLKFPAVKGKLGDPIQVGPATRLSLDALAGPQWRVVSWKDNDPAPEGLTLKYADGQFQGRAACNAYGAPVSAGDTPADIKVGSPRSTRMMCEASQMSAEQRFLGILPRMTSFWFSAGRLAVSYGSGAETGIMLFERTVD